jgi:phosphate-selective porin
MATLALVMAAALGARPAAAQDKPAAAPEAVPAPVASGYDKGFFIKAERFEIKFGTRLQLLYQYTDPDTFLYDSLLQDTEDTKPLNELFVRRLKFYMTGFAWNPALKYKVQFDVIPFKVGGGSGGGNVRLEEAFVDVTYKPWTQVRLGQFKVPFSYEKMTSSGKLDLVDRSIVHSFFGIDQEPGVNLYGLSFEKKFRYDVAVTTGVADQKGFNTANDVAADGKSDFRYMGRVTWEPLAPYTWEQGAVSSPDEPQLTLQLGFQSNRNTVPQDNDPFLPKDGILPFGPSELGAPSPTFDPATTASIARWAGVSQSRKPYDRNEVEGVAAFKYRRFYVEGQGIVGSVSPDTKWLQGKNPDLQDLTYDNSGYRLQAGFMLIPTKLELAGRWAQVDRKAEAKFYDSPDVKEEIENVEYRAGINWYFSKHDWKWQFDIGKVNTTRKLNGTKLVVPDSVANPDKLIQDNTRSDMVVRTQIQFQF